MVCLCDGESRNVGAVLFKLVGIYHNGKTACGGIIGGVESIVHNFVSAVAENELCGSCILSAVYVEYEVAVNMTARKVVGGNVAVRSAVEIVGDVTVKLLEACGVVAVAHTAEYRRKFACVKVENKVALDGVSRRIESHGGDHVVNNVGSVKRIIRVAFVIAAVADVNTGFYLLSAVGVRIACLVGTARCKNKRTANCFCPAFVFGGAFYGEVVKGDAAVDLDTCFGKNNTRRASGVSFDVGHGV